MFFPVQLVKCSRLLSLDEVEADQDGILFVDGGYDYCIGASTVLGLSDFRHSKVLVTKFIPCKYGQLVKEYCKLM